MPHAADGQAHAGRARANAAVLGDAPRGLGVM